MSNTATYVNVPLEEVGTRNAACENANVFVVTISDVRDDIVECYGAVVQISECLRVIGVKAD